MDIRCPKCSEPWDTDEFHYISPDEMPADAEFETIMYKPHAPPWDRNKQTDPYPVVQFQDALKAFRKFGCGGFGWKTDCDVNKKNMDIANAIYDLMGDDIDGEVGGWEMAQDMGLID